MVHFKAKKKDPEFRPPPPQIHRKRRGKSKITVSIHSKIMSIADHKFLHKYHSNANPNIEHCNSSHSKDRTGFYQNPVCYFSHIPQNEEWPLYTNP